MASRIDYSSFTLNTEEARDTSEVVFEQLYTRPELSQVHEVMTGVEMDRYIPFLGQFGLLGKTDPGGCAVNSESGQIPTSQKTWQPKLISYRLDHCQADVPDLLKFWRKSRIAANTWEEVNDEMLAFITDRATDATMRNIIRIADFSDPAIDTVGNGGVLTNGTDTGYFNQITGMWPQFFADQAGSAKAYRHTITENGEATYAAQKELSATAARDTLRSMYNNIDPRAMQMQGLAYQLTRSLFNNWVDFLEDKSLGFTLDRAEDGSTQFSYRGIPIVVRDDWDRIIKSYFDNGTTLYLPHRAVLSSLQNLPIGTSDEESMSELRSFYDFKDKKWYMDVAYKLDMKVLEEELCAIAY